jgi:hypothetical protein
MCVCVCVCFLSARTIFVSAHAIFVCMCDRAHTSTWQPCIMCVPGTIPLFTPSEPALVPQVFRMCSQPRSAVPQVGGHGESAIPRKDGWHWLDGHCLCFRTTEHFVCFFVCQCASLRSGVTFLTVIQPPPTATRSPPTTSPTTTHSHSLTAHHIPNHLPTANGR